MESELVAVIIFGILLLFLIPFIFYGLKMAGYNKLAFLISSIIFCAVIIPMIKYVYRDQMYNNEDLKSDLHAAGIGFKNPVKIITNDINGVKKLKQKTILIMDTVDINEIIKRIETNPKYIISPKILNLKNETKGKIQYKINRNYRFKDNYILETYGTIDNYTVRYTELKFRKNNDTVFLKKEEIY